MARQWRIEYPGAFYHVLSRGNNGQDIFVEDKEDVKHGLIYGSEDFASKIKTRFLLDEKNDELPQHNSMFVSVGFDELLRRGSGIKDIGVRN